MIQPAVIVIVFHEGVIWDWDYSRFASFSDHPDVWILPTSNNVLELNSSHLSQTSPCREKKEHNKPISYTDLCLGGLSQEQINLSPIKPVVSLGISFFVLDRGHLDLQGYKLHISSSSILQICFYSCKSYVPCADTVYFRRIAQKSRTICSVTKSTVI